MKKNQDLGSEIRHKHHSKSLVIFFVLKVRKFFTQSCVAYPFQIQDPVPFLHLDPGSGMEKSGTRITIHPGSTTSVGL
jgi:hypothetical protein